MSRDKLADTYLTEDKKEETRAGVPHGTATRFNCELKPSDPLVWCRLPGEKNTSYNLDATLVKPLNKLGATLVQLNSIA